VVKINKWIFNIIVKARALPIDKTTLMYSESSDNDESVGHDDLMKAEIPEKK
jgi:hypothetical protein